jgi:hypothetical protein
MPEGADLLTVGRLVMDLDPVATEYEFERDGFTITQRGDVQTLKITLTRDLAAQAERKRAKDGHPGQMDLTAQAGAEDE